MRKNSTKINLNTQSGENYSIEVRKEYERTKYEMFVVRRFVTNSYFDVIIIVDKSCA